jgi:transcriptional regulator with XRE-family HTH domain
VLCVHFLRIAQNAWMPKVKTFFKSGPPRHFIREWRKHRLLTLERLAERVGVTHGALSQLERGETNYTQPMLEALSDALVCTPGDLISRPPDKEPGLAMIWEQASPEDRERIARVIEAMGIKRAS